MDFGSANKIIGDLRGLRFGADDKLGVLSFLAQLQQWRGVLDSVASRGVVSIVAMAMLAVVLAVCSEADAFIAAGLSQFSLTSRLAFLVVGPMVDIKLVALQIGTFGRKFAYRFAPVTFVAAVGSAWLVGSLLL